MVKVNSSHIVVDCRELGLELLKERIDIGLGVGEVVELLGAISCGVSVIDHSLLLELRCCLLVLILYHLFNISTDIDWLAMRSNVIPSNLMISHHVVMVDRTAIGGLVDRDPVHHDHVISVKVAGHRIHVTVCVRRRRCHVVVVHRAASTASLPLLLERAILRLMLSGDTTLLADRLEDVLGAALLLAGPGKHLLVLLMMSWLSILLLLVLRCHRGVPIIAAHCRQRGREILVMMVLTSWHLELLLLRQGREHSGRRFAHEWLGLSAQVVPRPARVRVVDRLVLLCLAALHVVGLRLELLEGGRVWACGDARLDCLEDHVVIILLLLLLKLHLLLLMRCSRLLGVLKGATTSTKLDANLFRAFAALLLLDSCCEVAHTLCSGSILLWRQS